jgi:hypothetical protein
MKTNIHVGLYLAHFFLERAMFEPKFCVFDNFFSKIVPFMK